MVKKVKIFSLILFMAVFLISYAFSAEKVKCPYCGYLNEPEDRYCVNCLREIRKMTKEDQERLLLERKKVVLHAYEKAKENYFKAKQTFDHLKEKFYYELALMYAQRALREGKDRLAVKAKEELKKIIWISKERLSILRDIIKNPQSKVKLIKKGHNYYISVLLNNKEEALLHLDTGCSTTLISKKLADKLGIKGGEDVISVLADGSKVKGKRAIMKSIKVGDQVVKNVPIVVLDIPNDGLLGMSFLRYFVFQVDTKTNELILQRK